MISDFRLGKRFTLLIGLTPPQMAKNQLAIPGLYIFVFSTTYQLANNCTLKFCYDGGIRTQAFSCRSHSHCHCRYDKYFKNKSSHGYCFNARTKNGSRLAQHKTAASQILFQIRTIRYCHNNSCNNCCNIFCKRRIFATCSITTR